MIFSFYHNQAQLFKEHLIVSLLFVFVYAVAVLFLSETAFAGNGRDKSIVPAVKGHPLSNLWSGYYYSKKDIQALQDNLGENPGLKYVSEGAVLWSQKPNKTSKSCSKCHGNSSISMSEVGVRYPQYYAPLKRLINLEQRINICRKSYQKVQPFEYESKELLSLTSFVRAQAKGRPVRVKVDGFAKPFYEKGKAFYFKRRGQLDMSCAHCHENNYGKQLRSTLLSQGQSNGFPAYRVAWQKVGSLHRRFRSCNKLVRAKTYAFGADAYVNLELYLNWRGNGLEVETPAVRD